MAHDVKWIKITTDIFEPDGKLFAIESLPDGYLIEVVWFKLLVLTGKLNNNGFIVNSAKIPFTDEMLSVAFRIDLGTIQRALEIFEKYGMVEVVDNAYMISNWLKHQSGDRLDEIKENNRERQQRYRDKQKLIIKEDERNVTSNVTNNVNCSLSYSISNSNIYNLNLILTNKEYIDNSKYKEYIDSINHNVSLLNTLRDWLVYKDQRKPKASNRYAESSMCTLIKKFVTTYQKYGYEYVVSSVEDSMSNNYQGIIWKEIKGNQNQNKGNDLLTQLMGV